MKAILEFRNVHFSYNKKADENKILNGISFKVEKGSVMTMLGPSGSGKTTILRLALGLEKPDSGEIFINGRLVSSAKFLLPPEKRTLGLLFQDIALFSHLTVFENIAFGLKTKRHLSGLDKKNLVQELLKQIDLPHYADRYPHQLSGGEQQRVALARALAPGSQLILMDEPFSSLNERFRDAIRDWVLHFLEENSIAALMVTHSAEEAMFMSDIMAVLHDKKLQQQGVPLDLYYRPKDSFVAGIFGEINRYVARVENGIITTPLGKFRVAEFTNQKKLEGKMVELIIRADAIGIKNCPPDEKNGKVMEVRFLGSHLLVHWQCIDKEKKLPAWHIHSRLLTEHTNPIRFRGGAAVRASIDKKGVFIFCLD
ncbi:MAG: ABC transporter ATP-binding protein [Alphaproteobacteria bacterium]